MSKNILITGTSTGFGRDTAETLAQAGHKVFASISVKTAHGHAAPAAGVVFTDIVEP